ncbi:MAG TPA: hypothetical protein VE733_02250 [Streptosporangiaceae bacterium]|jgi:acyl-CoA synthetase (AMP-forming)/AMP-acid ligase II|nr:hypothetical protein [Streptosporangiaceae bacterium]
MISQAAETGPAVGAASSPQPGKLCRPACTTGDEAGNDVPPGTPGTLYVRGESAATGYWSQYDASRRVFQGEWLRTGDTYVQDADGYYTCLEGLKTPRRRAEDRVSELEVG